MSVFLHYYCSSNCFSNSINQKNKGQQKYKFLFRIQIKNEEVINWAIENYPIKIVDTGFNAFQTGLISAFDKNYHQDLSKARRLYPHTDGTEGFFFCKMR